MFNSSVTPWTAAHQAPLSKEFSRQEYCSRLPFPSPRDCPYPRTEPRSPALQADSLPSEPPGKPNGSQDSNPKPLPLNALSQGYMPTPKLFNCLIT